MSDFLTVLKDCFQISGAGAIAIIDGKSGTLLEAHGDMPHFRNMAEHAIKMAQAQLCGPVALHDPTDDILVTSRSTYQILTFLSGDDQSGLFLYLVLQRPQANLALARHKINDLAKRIHLSPELHRRLQDVRRSEEQRKTSRHTLFVPEEEDDFDELPPFMQMDNVLRLLNMK